jgi:ribosomal protein S18 acetylase RimI-like enzyme
MIIRRATVNDIPGLGKLFDAYRVFYGKQSDLRGALEFLEDRISGIESQVFISIEDDDRITGFIQLYPLYSSTRMARLWLLNDLYVDPEFRGKGISKQLIEKAKTLCRQTKACALILETAKDNEIANILYVSTGFKLDREHNYYEWEE